MQTNTNIRILLYEDNRDLREGMTFLLRSTPQFEFLGAFPDPRNLEMQISGLKPDVVLMDIDMPGRTGIEATPIVKAIHPAAQVIILTVFEEEDKIFSAIRGGASGYLLKRTPPTEIVAAIHDAHRGGSPMTSSIARKVLQYFQKQPIAAPATPDYKLSPRELEILKSLVKGYSYKLIADEHFISMDTVRSHIRNIYEKLQVNSKTEAVLKALKDKLTD
jgi:DNA-binding NarL/FixJ family response regulator